MTLHLFGIPNCDTVKRARSFLGQHSIEHEFHDFKRQGLAPQHVDRWIDALGWERLLNRQGTTWRRLDEAARDHVVDASSARGLMLASPSLIKRPVVEWPDGAVTVGFDPKQWSDRL
jgi:arsenate reductase (glutaredoxin)